MMIILNVLVDYDGFNCFCSSAHNINFNIFMSVVILTKWNFNYV